MELPILYSTDNKFWKIWVTKDGKIHIKYGRTNGAIREVPPSTSSSYEMACKKARTKWERQKNSRGYRETVPNNNDFAFIVSTFILCCNEPSRKFTFLSQSC